MAWISPLNVSLVSAALRLARQAQGGGTPTPTPTPTASADGFTFVPLSPASSYFPDDPVLRELVPANIYGADTDGSFKTFSEPFTLMARVPEAPYQEGNASDFNNFERVSYPSGAFTNRVVASRPIYDVDTGFTNNSTRVAPKPLGACLYCDRQTIRNDGSGHYYIPLEWLAVAPYYRGARTAPFLRYRITDSLGAQSAWIAATWADELPSGLTRTTACGFWATPDIATFADGSITVDWEEYPARGDSRSIRSTLDATRPRACQPLIFTKSSSSATAVYVADPASGQYGAPLGNDTTGTGTALAPYATIGKALNVLQSGSGRDGAIIYQMNDCPWGTTTVTTAGAATAFVTISPDPSLGSTVVTLTLPSANYATNCKYLRFSGKIVVKRASANFFRTTTGGIQLFENGAVLDINSIGTAAWTDIADTRIRTRGGEVRNLTASIVFTGSANIMFDLRYGTEILCPIGGSVAIDGYIDVGGNYRGVVINQGTSNARDYNGAIFAFYRFMGVGGANDIINLYAPSGQTILDGFADICGEFEITGNSAGPGIGISRDPPIAYGTNNVILIYPTAGGVANAGRINAAYDNNNTTAGGSQVVRTHTNWDVRGGLFGQWNTKGGQFCGTSGADPTNAPFHIGNIEQIYGCGFAYNTYLYLDAAGGRANNTYTNTFSQRVAGLGCTIGTATTTRSDVWSTYAGVTYNGSVYTAGAGGSVLNVKDTSAPQYQKVPTPILPFTLGKVARPTPDHGGARGLSG